MTSRKSEKEGERIARRIARAGLCSRREAEQWILAGRVEVNGKQIASPALDVSAADRIRVDGKALPERERTRLFLYHKPRGLVTSARDPQGRPTIFERLPKQLPRLVSVGRLDLNSEGLLLLTNAGGLARVLELPKTGWLRRYRVRAHGSVSQAALDALAAGITVDGIRYGAIEARLDREQGSNAAPTHRPARKRPISRRRRSGVVSSPTARAAKSRSSASARQTNSGRRNIAWLEIAGAAPANGSADAHRRRQIARAQSREPEIGCDPPDRRPVAREPVQRPDPCPWRRGDECAGARSLRRHRRARARGALPRRGFRAVHR